MNNYIIYESILCLTFFLIVESIFNEFENVKWKGCLGKMGMRMGNFLFLINWF